MYSKHKQIMSMCAQNQLKDNSAKYFVTNELNFRQHFKNVNCFKVTSLFNTISNLGCDQVYYKRSYFIANFPFGQDGPQHCVKLCIYANKHSRLRTGPVFCTWPEFHLHTFLFNNRADFNNMLNAAFPYFTHRPICNLFLFLFEGYGWWIKFSCFFYPAHALEVNFNMHQRHIGIKLPLIDFVNQAQTFRSGYQYRNWLNFFWLCSYEKPE